MVCCWVVEFVCMLEEALYIIHGLYKLLAAFSWNGRTKYRKTIYIFMHKDMDVAAAFFLRNPEVDQGCGEVQTLSTPKRQVTTGRTHPQVEDHL